MNEYSREKAIALFTNILSDDEPSIYDLKNLIDVCESVIFKAENKIKSFEKTERKNQLVNDIVCIAIKLSDCLEGERLFLVGNLQDRLAEYKRM